jgi:hypothetical protein
MRRDLYKGYAISALASQDDGTATDWVARAEISWTDGADKRSHVLTESVRRFGTLREAEVFAIQMSRSWIKELMDSKVRDSH